jgi:pimeloyl-ACP methyl ester carboxylesterase
MPKIVNLVRAAETNAKPTAIALHCSGANGSQWQQLGRDLGHRFVLMSPNLVRIGADGWTGEQPFTLSNEAAPIVRAIDATNGPLHLVGHSYGGCVALRAAIERPTRVASLILYEPAAFHVLKTTGPEGKIALAEITAVARDVSRSVLNGAHQAAAKRFVDYWSGDGSWKALRRETQDDLARYIPKACLEFSAAFGERMPLGAYQRLNCPVLILQGEHPHQPIRLIARQLAKAMKFSSLRTVHGTGHMGPLSHATVISAMMADHIVAAAPRPPHGENERAPDFDRAA